jgi:hypothetical protein
MGLLSAGIAAMGVDLTSYAATEETIREDARTFVAPVATTD